MFRQRENSTKEERYRSDSSWFVLKRKKSPWKLETIFCRSGVEDGQTTRLSVGAAEVFITFRVKTSDKFRREKEDVHSDINISIFQAIFGGSMKVPGIYEDHLLQVKS